MGLDVGDGVAAAAVSANDALLRKSRGAGERTMGAVAREALFAEALLLAVKAHVNELKAVAK
jgi:hypothetical protein